MGAPEDRPGLFDHAQITLTLGAYSHVLSEAQAEAVALRAGAQSRIAKTGFS
jgi:hypothetical protein